MLYHVQCVLERNHAKPTYTTRRRGTAGAALLVFASVKGSKSEILLADEGLPIPLGLVIPVGLPALLHGSGEEEELRRGPNALHCDESFQAGMSSSFVSNSTPSDELGEDELALLFTVASCWMSHDEVPGKEV